MGFATGGKDNRRPGGGGGGRFSKDWPTDPEFPDRPTLVDLSVAATAGNDGSPVSFSVNGFPDRTLEGRVIRVNPAVDPQTRQVCCVDVWGITGWSGGRLLC